MFPRGRSPDTLLSPNPLPQGSIRKGENSDHGNVRDYVNACATHHECFWFHYCDSHFISLTHATQNRGTYHTLTQSYHSSA